MNRRLPVTLVGGFLGAGKTSLLHHFISEHRGGYLAVLVENPGAVNLDARAIRGLCGAMRRWQDVVLEIPARDEPAQTEWLAETLRELAAQGRFEQVLIEVAGTANAARLGRCFATGSGAAEKLAPWAELREIVCVVDALDFYREAVVERRREPGGAEEAIAESQRAQIAGASLLVLNKCDLVGEAERKACVEKLLRLNASALLTEAAFGEVSSEVWSMAGTAARLAAALEEHEAEAEAGTAPDGADFASALYRAYRPFHPGRFWNWFNAEQAGLLRMKGLVWLATRNLLVGGVSRTRWQNSCGGAGLWWAALPREEWPQALERVRETWREPYGDRRQELILLGEAAALSAQARELNRCLLTDGELARGPKGWVALPDPFPVWDVGEEESQDLGGGMG